VGRDLVRQNRLAHIASFNPRARVGRDTTVSSAGEDFRSFNPRARVGRDSSTTKQISAYRSFNPRARVGRDSIDIFCDHVDGVSIHAPAWGATGSLRMVLHP